MGFQASRSLRTLPSKGLKGFLGKKLALQGSAGDDSTSCSPSGSAERAISGVTSGFYQPLQPGVGLARRSRPTRCLTPVITLISI